MVPNKVKLNLLDRSTCRVWVLNIMQSSMLNTKCSCKGPVKLIKRVKIAHSFLQSVSDQVLRYHFKLACVILQRAAKEFFGTYL